MATHALRGDMNFKTLVILICLTLIPMGVAYPNGTVKVAIEPKVFNVTYTPGRPLAGNAEFTPSVWHEDKPSGPFGDCSKANRLNFKVQKLIYPFRVPTAEDWYWASSYNIGSPDGNNMYKGLCIFDPSAMRIWPYKVDPFPNCAITVSEAANFCSKPENQGRRHVITKTVVADVYHANFNVANHTSYETLTINLSCDCNPLALSGTGKNVIYRTDNQRVSHSILAIGASNAVLPLTATVSSGQLPPGLSMKLAADSKELFLEGIPETEGDFRFSVKIKDACPLDRSDTRDFTISVRCGTMKFLTQQKLPDAVLKKPYSADIQTTCNGVYDNVRYELLGELPAGLSMSSSGKISGTPTEEKETYFYVSATGQEKGVSKEIHQRFDLVVAREIQVVPGLKEPGTGGEPAGTLVNTPEIAGVPSTCHPGDTLSVSYKGLTPQLGLKMGLFGEKEGGSNPALGWKSVAGASGTLSFTASPIPGRYIFRIYDKNGKTLVKSHVFTSVQTIADASAPGTASGLGASAAVDGPRVSTGVEKAEDLHVRKPSDDCAGTLVIKGMEGYKMASCVKRFDEARILIDPDPEAPGNPRYEGEKTTVVYEWAGEGVSPSVTQVKRYFSREAGRLGSKMIGDRQNFGAYELTRSGNKAYMSIDVYNDGRTVHVMFIEPENVEP
jgi:hypothetical protein